MNRSIWLMWTAVIGMAVIAITTTGRSSSAARVAVQTRLIAFHGLADRVREYDRLQTQTARWPAAPADTSLAQEVSAALAAAGLPASTLANLSPDNGTAVPGGPGLVQLRAGLTLNNVTLPQVGRFLAEWRRRQPSWTVTGIDLIQEQPKADAPNKTGGDLPLQAVLAMESIVADGAER
jgi:hypothetical protein